MKKLLTLIIALVMVLMVGACSPTSNTELEQRIEDLEARVSSLEQQADNTITSVGVNGQTASYINDDNQDFMVSTYSMMSLELMTNTEKDYLDKTKFPDYIWDLDGEYISINELGNKLTQKYLGVSSTTDYDPFIIRISSLPEFDEDELLVRISMMFIELSNYDFYTIDSTRLIIEFDGGQYNVQSRMSLLVSDDYDLHPAIFWNGLIDVQLLNLNADDTNATIIYDEFITNATFNGYVLPNYK